ncbi:hypothetical protein H9Q69_000311 [Fusarium xylarioides]|nr:hypothetical protein H9Q69_000311 [Fusarium xylarioides]KAG5804780.1 hypothetical protein H9Q71_010648 [Fusarium xylarioides]KAG5818851.1 hypothetical protein H9Q74_009816 [Fusarium xylarioides]
MSLPQSNERSISVTDKSESGSLTASSASNAASTKVSEPSLSTAPSGSNTNSTKGGVSTVAPTKTIVETATATIIKTTTATTTTTPQGDDAGLPISAITGLTVTSVVAIVAIFAISGLLYRKRRHQKVQPAPTSSPEVLRTATGFVGLPTRCLLTGASDSEIKQQLSALGLLIRRHVDGHYHRDNITATLDTLYSSLRQLQLSEAACHKIARLSIDPNSRRVAIRHLLALVIFSNLDIHTVGSLSLLPPTVKEMSQSRATALKEGHDSLVETAWESWYRITAFLMHEKPKTRSPLLPPPSAKSQAEALISALQEYLCHFVRRDDDHSIDDQLAGLAGVIRESVKFGYEVFSHPSDWEFTYTKDEQGGVVVVPGLAKRSSNTGELYRPPKMILTPEIATIKGLFP